MSAGDCLGVDCLGDRKKAARQQALLLLVLGVPAISPRVSPTTVNIHVYMAYRTGSNLVTHPSCVNLTNSIKCVGDSRSFLPYRRSHYALLIWCILLLKVMSPLCTNLFTVDLTVRDIIRN